jgi:hypothetical protein
MIFLAILLEDSSEDAINADDDDSAIGGDNVVVKVDEEVNTNDELSSE